jgi:hypothetical protein
VYNSYQAIKTHQPLYQAARAKSAFYRDTERRAVINSSIQKPRSARIERRGDLEAGPYENIEMVSANKARSPAVKKAPV